MYFKDESKRQEKIIMCISLIYNMPLHNMFANILNLNPLEQTINLETKSIVVLKKNFAQMKEQADEQMKDFFYSTGLNKNGAKEKGERIYKK